MLNKAIFLLPLLLLLSCSLQKRKYQNGYYVDWNHKKTIKEKKNSSQTKSDINSQKADVLTATPISTGDRPNLVEATKNVFSEVNTNKRHTLKNPTDTCDLLIFKDGSELRAKVEEVGVREIRYKRCDSPDGPLYVTRKSDIFMIKYMNGTKEVFKSEPVPIVNQAPTNAYKTNKYNRVNHPLAAPSLIAGIVSIVSVAIAENIGNYNGSVSDAVYYAIPIVLGVIAIILGAYTLARIKDQPDVYKGKGPATTGMIMGIVIACISAILLLTLLPI